MKIIRLITLFSFLSQLSFVTAFAETVSEFKTPRDLLGNNVTSGISLKNNGSAVATVYGLYIKQYGYVTPGASCDSPASIYPASDNVTAGAYVSPITISPGKSASIGSNYLYNMLYEANYYVGIIYPSSPPGCALPGCTWGSDSTIYNWCIYLGALAPVTTSTGYVSNVPPSTDAASSGGTYNYNLVNNYVTIGPISCNDQTLTCSVANPQTQSFN